MRPIALAVAALVLLGSGPSLAQDWIEYASRADLFTVNFPGQPNVREITYPTEYDITLPGRVYSVEAGRNRYSVTVVDYTNAEKIHTARAEECRKAGGEGDACGNRWRAELQGAIVYATWHLLQRDVKLTHYAHYNADQVEGHRLQLTNADGSRTFAAIHRHGTRLYLLEATVPPRAPAPGLFQQSLQFLDEEGKPIRYRSYYTTGYGEEWRFPAPSPPRAR